MEKLRKQLEAELNEAEEERQQIEEQLDDKPDFGLGEGATFANSWEMALARKEDVEARIEALKAALSRVENGTYGICQNCGNQIHPERLEILPTTTLCTPCAQKQKN